MDTPATFAKNFLLVVYILIISASLFTVPIYIAFLYILRSKIYKPNNTLNNSFFRLIYSAGWADLIGFFFTFYVHTFLVYFDNNTFGQWFENTANTFGTLTVYLLDVSTFITMAHLVAIALNRLTATFLPTTSEAIWINHLALIIRVCWCSPCFLAVGNLFVEVLIKKNKESTVTGKTPENVYTFNFTVGTWGFAKSAFALSLASTVAVFLIGSYLVIAAKLSYESYKLKKNPDSVDNNHARETIKKASLSATIVGFQLSIPFFFGIIVYFLMILRIPFIKRYFSDLYQISAFLVMMQDPYTVIIMSSTVRKRFLRLIRWQKSNIVIVITNHP